MNILFIIPRYHPNYRGMVFGLQKAGHQVAIMPISTGPKAYLGHEAPVIDYPITHLSRWLRKNGPARSKSASAILPNIFRLHQQIEKFGPDVIVCRDLTITTRLTTLLCFFSKTPLILYTQSPLGNGTEPFSRKIKFKCLRALKLMPQYRFTTSFGECETSPANEALLPFGMDGNDIPKRTKKAAPPSKSLPWQNWRRNEKTMSCWCTRWRHICATGRRP